MALKDFVNERWYQIQAGTAGLLLGVGTLMAFHYWNKHVSVTRNVGTETDGEEDIDSEDNIESLLPDSSRRN